MSAEPNTHYPIVDAALATIADWVNRCRQLTLPSAFGECDSKEIARIAADLGITADDLRDFAEAKPGSAEFLGHILPALGIDPDALTKADPLVMRDLQRLCVTCQNKTRCRHELEETSAAAHFHEFCPNAVTLDAILTGRKN